MSTKIYNAYRIKTMSELSKKKMLDTVKKMMLKKQELRLTALIEAELIKMFDTVRVADFYNDYDVVKKHLYKTSIMMQSPRMIINSVLHESKISDNILDCSPYLAVRTKIENMIEYSDIDNSIMSDEYNFSNKIVFYPLSTKYTLLQVFGKDISDVFFSLSDYDSFKTIYSLEDYHYQNSTDKPEKISKRTWSKRKKDWNTVFTTSVPICDGICVDMSLNDHDIFRLFDKSFTNAIENLPSVEARISKQAEKRMLDICYKNEIEKLSIEPSYSDSVEIIKNIKLKYETGDKDLCRMIIKITDEISPLFVDITKDKSCDILFDANIRDLYPNYIDSCNLK